MRPRRGANCARTSTNRVDLDSGQRGPRSQYVRVQLLLVGAVLLVAAPMFFDLERGGRADWDSYVTRNDTSRIALLRYGEAPLWNPYAAGGNYIDKMSDYCKHCAFDVREKNGSNACPFNYLYWDFLARNREKLGQNPRLGPVYRTWGGMSEERKKQVRENSAQFLKTMI